MKQIASIFFLGILVFNCFGYRLLSSFLEERANAMLIASLDSDQYNEADLITIKLPSRLPYYTNSGHFSRMDGEIELNGIHYNYVKCRMYKDSVEYSCIPNKDKMKLNNASNEFYKLVNDLQHPSQNKKSGDSGSVKSPLSEYYQNNNSWEFSVFSPGHSVINFFYLVSFPKPELLPRELPPDIC